MGPITLTWIAAMIFSGLVFWGVNVPTGRRTPAIYWVTGLLIVFHLLTQSFLFRVDTSPGASAAAKRTAAEAMVKFDEFLSATAVGPGKLHYHSPLGWYRIFTSSFLHYGWLHLIFNAWFFVLFGHVIEHVFGARKFLAVVAAGLILPPALDGFFPVGLSRVDVRYTGGFSGVVYAVMGAYLVCFPNSRAYGAVNYDLRFWAALLFLLLPVTMVTRFAGVALTETVIIMGIVAAFLLIQPEHARISSPVITVMLYKLLQDILLLEPAVSDVFSNSVWRIGGGFAVGIAGGFILNGVRGWKLRWGDETREGARFGHNTRARMSIAKLEAEGRKSEEGARVYLGQRVFVGDAERAIAFYREVIMPKFPNVSLPLQEQLALARLLHFKGREAEALHAYEILLKQEPLPEEYSIARLKAAELIIKIAPDRSQRARELLDRFERGHITMVRDRIEAQQLRAMLPVVQSEYSETTAGSSTPWEPAQPTYGDANEEALQSSLRGRNKRQQKEESSTASKKSSGIDAPKVRPKSFMYVPGAAPVKLSDRGLRSNRELAEDADLSPEELLRKHWKPLPGMASNKPLPPSVLERRVKNARVADEDDKPTMYGGSTKTGSGERRSGGRLSQLELIKICTEIPTAQEMPSQYGGFDDAPDETLRPDALSSQPIKLRSEKSAPDKSTLETRFAARRRRKDEKSKGPLMEWGARMQPAAISVEAGVKKLLSYSDRDTPQFEAGEQVRWAVLLVDANEVDLAREAKRKHPELAQKYGTSDFSEVTGLGFQPLFLYRGVPDSEKAKIESIVEAVGLQVKFLLETDPVLTLDPVEVVGISANHTGCTLKTSFGSRRIAWDELALVSLCDIRLTPNSRSLHRYVLELVILSGKPQRFQLFERTVSAKGSTVDDKTFNDARELLENAWIFAGQLSLKARIFPDNSMGRQTGKFPVFESYAWYNEEVLRLLLLK